MASEIRGKDATLRTSQNADSSWAAAAKAYSSKQRRSSEKTIRIVLALALISVAVLGAVEYRWTRQTADDNRWVSHTQDVLRELQATQTSLNDSDACAENFLLSAARAPAPGCGPIIQGIRDHMRNLQMLTIDNPLQQQRLASLVTPARNATNGLEAEIALGRAAEPRTLKGSVRQAVLLTRTELGEMEATELALLGQRKEIAERAFGTTGFLIFAGTSTAFVLLAISGAALQLGMEQRRRAEAALREEEQKFSLMVEGVQDYAIFMLDPDGRISSWNKGAQRIKGYDALEIIGRHFSTFYTEPDLAAGTPEQDLLAAEREGRVETEGWRVRKDGSRFWANALITARRSEAGELIGFSKVTQDVTDKMRTKEALQKEVTERRAAQEKLRESERSLRDLSLHLLRTQDEERRRIGRDMHDSLGQSLSVIKMRLDSLIAKQAGGPSAVSELEKSAELADECIREVRTISYLLYPPMLEEMGLSSAVPWYLDGFASRSGIKTALEMVEDFERLPRDVELTIFRVLQESLTNVHRHSSSPTAQVTLARNEHEVVLEVKDEGKGAPAPGALEEPMKDWTGTHGVGLRGMDERLQQLGGKLEVAFSETGTVVRATIPI